MLSSIQPDVIKTTKYYQLSLYKEVNETNLQLNLVNRKREEAKKLIVKNWRNEEAAELINENNELHEQSENLALKQTILYNKYVRSKQLLFLLENNLINQKENIRSYFKEALNYFENNEEYEACQIIFEAMNSK